MCYYVCMDIVRRGKWRYVVMDCQVCESVFERRMDAHNRAQNKTQCNSCTARIRMTRMATKHGMYGTPTYVSWLKMKDRCLNPNHKHYPIYGGRGITIDPKWMAFEGFFDDMGSMPQEGYSIDRIDNDKGYTKSNCRWLPRNEQQKNRRCVKQGVVS